MGIVSCLGNNLEDVATSLHECKPGIRFNDKYEEIGMKSKVCGTPDIDCDEFIDRKQGRFMGLNAKFAFIAMQQVSSQPALTPSERRSGRTVARRVVGRRWRIRASPRSR